MSEALNSLEAAALCGVSERHWFSLSSSGRTPLPIRLGRSTRWLRRELEQWLVAGCPARSAWEQLKARGARPYETAALK